MVTQHSTSSHIGFVFDEVKTYRVKYVEDLEAETDRRLALLKRWNDKRIEKGRYCPFCFVAPISVLNPIDDAKPGRYILYHYEDSHAADGCELAEALGDG